MLDILIARWDWLSQTIEYHCTNECLHLNRQFGNTLAKCPNLLSFPRKRKSSINQSPPKAVSCNIANGTGGGGIGHCHQGGSVSNSIIRGNHANYVGGPISGIGDLFNCLIVYNSAGFAAGAIDAWHSELSNSTIVGNVGSTVLYNGFGSIRNCIVWGNSNQGIGNESPVVEYTCYGGGYTGIGNIDVDPCCRLPAWRH